MRRTATTSLVLGSLASEPARWRHGYSLMEETGLRSGTLYPILRRLAEHGLLEARWEPPSQPGRPARHLYRLTAAGAERATADRTSPRRGPIALRVAG